MTIPKDAREALGVSSGDRVTFVVEGNTVLMINSAVYAMRLFQTQMRGSAERAGLTTEADIEQFIKGVRATGGTE